MVHHKTELGEKAWPKGVPRWVYSRLTPIYTREEVGRRNFTFGWRKKTYRPEKKISLLRNQALILVIFVKKKKRRIHCLRGGG